MRNGRLLALGGIAGPAAFITAWLVLGARATGYSPLEETISQLAALDAPTRTGMTVGVLAFGTGVPLYALALRSALPGRAWMTALAAGVATSGVALFPLGSGDSDAAHVVCVAVAYGALVATPLLAARSMAAQGRRSWRRVSLATGAVTAVLLVASLLSPLTGLFQRAGLGVVDLWIMATAVEIVRGRRFAGLASRR